MTRCYPVRSDIERVRFSQWILILRREDFDIIVYIKSKLGSLTFVVLLFILSYLLMTSSVLVHAGISNIWQCFNELNKPDYKFTKNFYLGKYHRKS